MAKKSPMMVENDKWQVEDDLRTLCRAEEIKKDPKRYAKAKAMAKEKMMEHASIANEE